MNWKQYIPLLQFYGPPFVIGVVLPGWRSLAAWAVPVLAVLVLGLATSGSGAGAALGMVIFMTAGAGAVAGLMTRAMTLWLGAKGSSWRTVVPVTMIGFLVIPGLVAGLDFQQTLSRRAPSPDCMTANILVLLGDEQYAVPSAPALTLWISRHAGGIERMASPDAVRRFCRTGSGAPHRLTASWFDGDEMRLADPLTSSLCRRADVGWFDPFCHPVNRESNSASPATRRLLARIKLTDPARNEHPSLADFYTLAGFMRNNRDAVAEQRGDVRIYWSADRSDSFWSGPAEHSAAEEARAVEFRCGSL